jgi:hypothetical protein
MTFTEGAAIVSGLAIGYWLISVFLPNAGKDDADGGDPTPPRENDSFDA